MTQTVVFFRVFRVPFSLACVLAVACTRMNDSHPRSDAADRAAIDSLHQQDIRAVMASDTATLMSLWTDDIVSLPPSGPIRSGRAANAALLRESMKQSAGIEPVEYRLDFQEVQILGTSAFEWGTFKAVARDRSGGASMTTTGKVMRLLRRNSAGQWKVARTMFTVDP